jgi:hypothetical protein
MTKLAGLLVVLAPSVALADAKTDAIQRAADDLAGFSGRLDPKSPWSPRNLDEASYKPAECDNKLAAAKKSGIKPTDVLKSNSFEYHPKAKPTGKQYEFQIEFADADWICTAFATRFKLESAVVPMREAAEFMAGKTSPTAADARGFNTGAGKSVVDKGQACIKAADQLIKDGVAPTTKVVLKSGESTLEGGKKHCQAMIEYGTRFEEFIAVEQKAKRAERAKKYEDAGIKGAKLALMIEYDDVYWRGAGCEKIDDIPVLAKASVLFQWLENSNGTHTIRKYVFAGNAVKGKSEKTFKTEEAAYKGCY